MTLSELKTKINSKLLEIKPLIEERQEAYFLKRNRYWQGIATPQKVPSDGLDTTIETTLKPSYQTEDWSEMGLNVALPMQLEIHQYRTPKNECGYVVIVKVKLGDEIYIRTAGYGVQADILTQSWFKKTD